MGLITAVQLADYLGADEDSLPIVEGLWESAVARLEQVMEQDPKTVTNCAVVNEALRTMVYISFYAVRGGAQNLEFLERHLAGLINELRFQADREE